jgi:glycosyltransferase involved in cell wall biosynthesis
MRILTVCQFYESRHGGGIVVARLLRRLMEDRGHRVDVLCLEGGDDPQPGRVFRLKPLPWIGRDFARQLLLFLNNRAFDRWFVNQLPGLGFESGQYDVVHCQDFLSVGVCEAVARLTGAQWGVTLHEFLPRQMSKTSDSPWLGKLLENACQRRDRQLLPAYQSTTWLAGVSKAVSRSAEFFVGTWRCKVETVYNAYTSSFSPPTRRFPNAGEPLKFLYVGRLSPEKGVDLLLEAFARHPEQDTLSLVGLDGALKPMVLQHVAKDPRIRLLPPQPYEAMAAVYQDHDVVCCPASWEEPFGLTTLEARACGRGVVATRRGGIPEILEGYPRAELIEAGKRSREEMVIALTLALGRSRHTAAADLDAAAEAKFMNRFSTETFVRGYERLYGIVRY